MLLLINYQKKWYDQPFKGWSSFVSINKYFQNAGLCYSIGGTRLQ